jgi:hypothetical protein
MVEREGRSPAPRSPAPKEENTPFIGGGENMTVWEQDGATRVAGPHHLMRPALLAWTSPVQNDRKSG